MGAWLWLALAAVPVEVTADACVGIDAAEVKRIAQIELGQASGEGSPVVVRFECRDTEVEVAVDDPVTRKSLARRIVLATIDAKARDRTAALALAELVHASWSELLLPPPTVAPAQAPALTREEAAPLQPVPSQRLRLSAQATGRWLPSSGLLQGGGEIGALFLPAPRLAVGLGFDAEHGSVTSTLGRLDVDSIGGAALLFVTFTQTETSLLLGGGLRGGGARVSGTGVGTLIASSSVSGAWLGPALDARLYFGGTRLLATVGLELGYAAVSVRGLVDGHGGAGIDGAWLTATVGVEVRP